MFLFVRDVKGNFFEIEYNFWLLFCIKKLIGIMNILEIVFFFNN